MASRVVVAQQSAARTPKRRNDRSASALEPVAQHKTPQPHTPVPCQSGSEEEKKSKKEEATPDKLSRKEAGRPAAVEGTATPAIVGEVICSPGQPLDPATRAFSEPRFGYDFSRVRIRNDARASAAAHAVNALDRLKTIQSDILGSQNFRVNCPPASDSACRRVREAGENVAVVPAGNPNELDICAPFFKRNVEDCASTIIHEFGHAQLGLSARQQMDDRGYQGDAFSYQATD